METALVVAAVALGVGACLLMAWIERRRGHRGWCSPARARVGGELQRLCADPERVNQRTRAVERGNHDA